MKNLDTRNHQSVSDSFKKHGAKGVQKSYNQRSYAPNRNPGTADIMAQHIHVPRKFARRHARGISFNSTGKAMGDKENESSMSRPFIKPLIYDKATLEAE